jgi:hypothetical protein
MSVVAVVNQIIRKRQVQGKVQVLVQWAVSWASAEEMVGQVVSQIMGTRVRGGVTEFLTNWACSWTDISDELMAGDMWQPFLDEEAKAEADEEAEPKDGADEKAKSKDGAKTKVAVAMKRGVEDADVRRSVRNRSK